MDELEKIREKKMRELMLGMLVSDADDQNFAEKVVERSKKLPVVADFWSSRCGPCLMLKPILETLAREYNGKFALVKINVDSGTRACQEYQVSGIPSVKMFKNGKVAAEFVGAMPEHSVRGWLDKNLAK